MYISGFGPIAHININIKTEENKLDYKYFWASDHLETNNWIRYTRNSG